MELKHALENLRVFIETLKTQTREDSAANFFDKMRNAETLFTSEGLGGVLLVEKESTEYQKLVGDLYLAVARQFGHAKKLDELHISKGSIESAIQATILRALDAPKQSKEPFEKRLTTCLNDLKSTLLKKSEPWLVHMEVRGIAPWGLPIRFGEIEFYVAGRAREKDQPGAKSSGVTETAIEHAASPSLESGGFAGLLQPKEGAIYAIVPVSATDTEAAKVIAERKLRLTVDTLNYFSDFFDVLESRVTLPGDATVSDVKTFVYSPEKMKHSAVGWTGKFLPFSFAAVNKSSAKASGFERVSSILGNPSPGSLDERILSSLRWAGRASVEGRREQAFLLFCISLEALLLGGQKTEIAQTFALRGAHLLVADAAHRKEVFKDLKSLYGIRSGIVHSGLAQLNEAELSKIRWLAKTALLIMLVREPFSTMKKEQELEEWFEAQLLAGVV